MREAKGQLPRVRVYVCCHGNHDVTCWAVGLCQPPIDSLPGPLPEFEWSAITSLLHGLFITPLLLPCDPFNVQFPNNSSGVKDLFTSIALVLFTLHLVYVWGDCFVLPTVLQSRTVIYLVILSYVWAYEDLNCWCSKGEYGVK